MKSVVPFVAMVIVQCAQVALMVVGQKAMSSGMTNLTFVFYSNALASLILLPLCFFIPRSSTRPPLNFSLLCGFALLGLLGFLAQVFGYAGIQYSSVTLCSAMLNLIPGFTFVLAILFRMEKVECRSSSTQAKSIGTVLSIAGAFVIALYKGPPIFTTSLLSKIPHWLLLQPSNWVIGGLFLVIDCAFASLFLIAQAKILKRYPVELIVSFFYFFTVTILSAVVSLTVQKDFGAWSLQPNLRLLAVLYSGVFGSAFQVTVSAWCVQRIGPLFVAMFHPLGIVVATVIGIIFLGDAFYLGSLVGSVVIVIGFYSVMWGKAKEGKKDEVNQLTSERSPLLQNDVEERVV